jgi:hypothetical protein
MLFAPLVMVIYKEKVLEKRDIKIARYLIVNGANI